MNKSKTPIAIITGYLGSGKTTLLRNILDQSDKKLAILMNEFGEIGIDGKIIKGKNVDMVELSGGCVCCSLTGEFEAAIKEVVKKIKPEMIVVETTGVAEPDALIFDIEENIPEVKLEVVITIIDCDSIIRFPNLGQTGKIQIEMADLLIMNKIDLVTKKQIQEIEEGLKELNERAVVLKSIKCELDTSLLFGIDVNKKRNKKVHKHETENIEFFVYSTRKFLNKNKFEKIIQNLPKNIYRAKGLVKFSDGNYLFNYVAGRYDFEKFQTKETQIIFIGIKAKTSERKIKDMLKEVIR